ncbi:S41 family peptidase [Sinorhizobium mexicanum]|uniref:PDZ domain-containing protein n=1 Tax=Sinorhizobium mexicanum TaxID=375549 RepID=A0A859QJU6_9HYPH|nr:S41 family peptidase [Sinorhizobium mexicanum]MBP1884603.1 C-terminal processing protease CtpA/Prc [Sinorhizobium mexicanum]QLL66262.1 PDZ domain-containing protein [Sinorhizobium mexicanum]
MRARTVGSLPLILLLFFTSGRALALEPPRSGQPVFDRAVELTVDNFHDASALDRFVAAVRREIEDVPLTAKSSQVEVDKAIDTVLASLGASHTARFKRDTIDYFELIDIFRFAVRNDMRRLFPPDGEVNYAGIGMVTQSNGQRFVTDVYDGSPADRAGILVGDEILSVDGAPYREVESFRDKVGRTVEVRLRRQPGAVPIAVKVTVERLRPLRTFERAIESSVKVTEHDGRRIGYVRLWTLSTEDGLDIVARELATGRLKDADGVIVDLRGRWGGGPADAAELFVGDTPTFRLISRGGKETLANVRWRRPVVAIIDEGARSGLELFAYALKMNGIPLVGTRTAGALLAGRAYLLPDDSLLELAVSDAVIDEGLRLEGRGVDPDIPVPFSLPYAAGKDPQFDAAIEEMRRILVKG